jgi:hypothetical protein
MTVKINKWSALLVVSFFHIFNKTYCQNDIEYRVRPAIGSNLAQIGKIIFHDSISGHKKTFNVLKNNPFNNYHFRNLGKNDQENLIYKMSYDELDKLIPLSFRSGYTEERRQIRKIQTGYYNGTSYYVVNKELKGYSVISYSFTISAEDYAVAVLGSVIVFNKAGKCIYKDKIIDVNINKAVITENGNFLCYSYGGDLDGNGSIIPAGFRIIDIKTKKILIDRQHPSLGSPFVVRNLIVNGYDEYRDCSMSVFVVFDSDHRSLYTKGYCFGENLDSNQLKEITDTGFLFLSKDNEPNLDSFEETFKKEIIE